MINDVGARQGIVPWKNVVSAAKTRSLFEKNGRSSSNRRQHKRIVSFNNLGAYARPELI